MKYIFIFLGLLIISMTVIGYFQYRHLFVNVDKDERVANIIRECEDNLDELEDDYNFIVRNASRLSHHDRQKISSLKAKINFFRVNINSLKKTKDEARIILLVRTCDQVYNSARALADNLIAKIGY